MVRLHHFDAKSLALPQRFSSYLKVGRKEYTMKNLRVAAVVTAFTVVCCVDNSKGSSSPTTFYKDALPILQRNCQNCHRPGQIGPMPLLTFEQARPWAKDIKLQVASRKMPPWFATRSSGISKMIGPSGRLMSIRW